MNYIGGVLKVWGRGSSAVIPKGGSRYRTCLENYWAEDARQGEEDGTVDLLQRVVSSSSRHIVVRGHAHCKRSRYRAQMYVFLGCETCMNLL